MTLLDMPEMYQIGVKNDIQLKDSNKLDPIYELMPTNGGSWNEIILKNSGFSMYNKMCDSLIFDLFSALHTLKIQY